MNLPEIHNSHDQENKSINQLLRRFEEKLFLVRDVRTKDYGVDFNIEPKLENSQKKYASNFICQIQLKSISSDVKIRRRDNSLSFNPSIKNINYLLNHYCALYIVYVQKTDTFYWEWVPEIAKHFSSQGIDIQKKSKKKKVFRFKKILNDQSFELISQKIISIGSRIRNINHLLESESDDTFEISRRMISSLSEKHEVIRDLCTNGEFKSALKEYERIAEFTNAIEDYEKASEIAILAKKYKKGLKLIGKVLSSNCESAKAYYIKGLCLIKLMKYDEAEYPLELSLQLSNNISTLKLLAGLKLTLGKVNEAIDKYEVLLQVEEPSSELYELLGDISYVRFEFSRASYFYDSALSIDPDNIKILTTYGYLCLEMGNLVEAEVQFEKLNTLSKNFNTISGLAICKHIKGEKQIVSFLLSELNDCVGNDQNLLVFLNSYSNSIISIKNCNNRYELEENKIHNMSFKKSEIDKIMIGVFTYENENFRMPFVSKMYSSKVRYDNAINQIRENTNLMFNVFGDERCADAENETTLLLKEHEEKVSFKLIICGGYIINGMTDRGYKKSFNQFVEYYSKHNMYQVELYCLESNEFIHYVVNGNVEFEILK